MADDKRVVLERGDGCGWLIFCAILAFFLFAGDPDIHDLTMHALKKYVNS